MNQEVLIYLEKIKHFFKTNADAKSYFINDGNEDVFFEHLSEISEKNYETRGEPELTQEQLELLRRTILVLKIAKENHHYSDDGLFLFFKDYLPICMN